MADTLSRKSIEYQDSALQEGMEAQVHTVLSSMSMTCCDTRLTENKHETTQDVQLGALRRATLTDWLDTKKQCPPSIQEYWNHRDEISQMDGHLV